MTKAQLRFSPEILKRLGEELNPFLDKGVLELAKNAYDADAVHCKITLEEIDRPGGRITITDDGRGMSVDDILCGWLVLGKSGKSTKSRTALGRVPSGSKGLGRLAALRLGQRAHLVTRPKKEAQSQHELSIQWSDFDGARAVDEVPLMVKTHPRPAKVGPGTSIQLRDLNSQMTRGEVRRLARELILLADPFGDDPKGFKPELVAPEFADLATLVKERYFGDADYHLSGRLDEQGRASANVTDYRGETLFSGEHGEMASEDSRTYECPTATFDFWVFVLDSTEFSSTRTVSLGEVKDWLGAFGGVHLYQNGIRVSPYGDPNDDWLGLNLRRSKHQEDNPSTNTVIGRVMITDREELLQQKTDRSGFIETDAFRELRRFAADATKWLFRRRNAVSQVRRAKEREAALAERPTAQALSAAIKQAPPKVRRPLERAFAANERSHQAAREKLQREIQLYRTLSTVGITAATFSHESVGRAIKMISFATNTIESRTRLRLAEDYPRLLEKQVGKIRDALQNMSVLGNAAFSLLDHDKRRARGVKLHEVIAHAVETLRPFTNGRDIQVAIELDSGEPYLRASEAAIESIVTNFINNAVTAFETSRVAERKICLRTEIHGRTFTLRVLDNGPGIKGISKKDIWLPGETTRPNGTGLGLTIVRDTVLDLAGDVDVIERGATGGAEFIVRLPILRS